MWTLQLKDPTYSGPLFLRHDYKAAVSLKNHLTRTQKTTRGRFHRRIKIAKDDGVNLQTHTVKALKLTQRRDGGSGYYRRLLHPGGRVITGMNGTVTTLNMWQRIWVRCRNSTFFLHPKLCGQTLNERRATINGVTRILSEISQAMYSS